MGGPKGHREGGHSLSGHREMDGLIRWREEAAEEVGCRIKAGGGKSQQRK